MLVLLVRWLGSGPKVKAPYCLLSKVPRFHWVNVVQFVNSLCQLLLWMAFIIIFSVWMVCCLLLCERLSVNGFVCRQWSEWMASVNRYLDTQIRYLDTRTALLSCLAKLLGSTTPLGSWARLVPKVGMVRYSDGLIEWATIRFILIALKLRSVIELFSVSALKKLFSWKSTQCLLGSGHSAAITIVCQCRNEYILSKTYTSCINSRATSSMTVGATSSVR